MEKAVREQLNSAEKMMKDAEKSQKMAYSQLRSHLNMIPKEHKGFIDGIMQKVSKLEETQDPKLAQDLQTEVNNLIRKQREDAS